MLKYLLAAVAAITVVASAHAAEDEVREAAPIGLVGERGLPGANTGWAWAAARSHRPTARRTPGAGHASGTWATPSQLSGGVPSYMPVGYDVTTVPALNRQAVGPSTPCPAQGQCVATAGAELPAAHG